MLSHVVVVKEEVVMGIWWEHNALKFPNVVFLAQQILGILGS
jgi:hypothetical protein